MPTISGIVRDGVGDPCEALVRVTRRYDMSLVGQVLSNASTGAYSVTTADATPHIVERFVAPVGELNAQYRKLGLHMDGTNNSTTFVDVSPLGSTVTANGDAKVDAVSTDPYGGTSGVLLLDGTGDYLQVAYSAERELGSGDLTVRAKVKTTSTTAYATFIARPAASSFASPGWVIMNNSGTNGRVAVWVADYSVSVAMLLAPSGSINDDNYHDIEWTRSGSTNRLFIDGTVVATTTWGGTIATNTRDIYIGTDPNQASRLVTGSVKDVEILVGKAAHTANFTPTTSTFIDYFLGTPTENIQIFDNVTPV